MRHSRTNATSLVVMVAPFVRDLSFRMGSSVHPRSAPSRTARGASGSGSWSGAADPFVEADAAEARFAQRHERAFLDAATEVSGFGITHDRTRVADRLQISGDEFVEGRAFRPGDLDDAVSWRRERHIGDDGSNVVRRDGLEQAG